MVDIKLLEEVLPDINNWNYGDLKEIKLLSYEDIKSFTKSVLNTGDFSDKDVLDICVTALHHMRKTAIRSEDVTTLKRDIRDIPFTPVINEPYVSKGTPLPIRYETTVVEKCEPVVCEERETADDMMSDACGRLMCMGSYFDEV